MFNYDTENYLFFKSIHIIHNNIPLSLAIWNETTLNIINVNERLKILQNFL